CLRAGTTRGTAATHAPRSFASVRPARARGPVPGAVAWVGGGGRRDLHHLEPADGRGCAATGRLALVLRLDPRDPAPGAFGELEVVGHHAAAHHQDAHVGAFVKPVAHPCDAEEERLVLVLHRAAPAVHAAVLDL